MLRVLLPPHISPALNAQSVIFCGRKTFQSHGLRSAALSKGYTTRDFTLNQIARNLHHSTFTQRNPLNEKLPRTNENEEDLLEGISQGKGKLAPTASHMFRLILPLSRPGMTPPPTVFLLHPSQPLSYVAQSILRSLAPTTAEISFQSISPDGKPFQWCDSAEVGDFLRDATKAASFQIVITHYNKRLMEQIKEREGETKANAEETVLTVQIPTFVDRTRFLRRRLEKVESKLEEMKVIKKRCDQEANRGARRLAVAGLGVLVAYWATVCRLTFWEFGWDVMEPVTYLSGLTIAISGYLWFLYQGREVSYSSVLNRSISNRREALYHTRGFDVELWTELIAERKGLCKEIKRIAEDYNEEEGKRPKEDEDGEEEAAEVLGKEG